MQNKNLYKLFYFFIYFFSLVLFTAVTHNKNLAYGSPILENSKIQEIDNNNQEDIIPSQYAPDIFNFLEHPKEFILSQSRLFISLFPYVYETNFSYRYEKNISIHFLIYFCLYIFKDIITLLSPVEIYAMDDYNQENTSRYTPYIFEFLKEHREFIISELISFGLLSPHFGNSTIFNRYLTHLKYRFLIYSYFFIGKTTAKFFFNDDLIISHHEK